jgi:hypothetical protein
MCSRCFAMPPVRVTFPWSMFSLDVTIHFSRDIHCFSGRMFGLRSLIMSLAIYMLRCPGDVNERMLNKRVRYISPS